ncbi:MAG: HAMP domain-containing protein [Chloracidobacterium sp.]|nr:HAMP domain-containing protein [Chloracidobacterium sp.]
MIDSIRTRLTLWHVGVLALALIVFSSGVYLLLARNFHRRMDESLLASSESIAISLVRERAEGETEAEAARSATDELRLLDQAMAVFDVEGRLLAEKPTSHNEHARLPPLDSISSDDNIRLYTAPGDGAEGQRVVARRVRIGPADLTYLIVVSQPLVTITEELAMLRREFMVAIPLALLLAGLGGFFLARKSLAPVVAMSEQARKISAENLEQRLPVANPRDELGQLANAFNELLARLDASFDMQRQFMADASHELRTPLSVMRTTAQVILERSLRDESEYRGALAMIDDQTRRLAQIVDDMFTLARADAGRRPLASDAFYMDELVAETSRAASVLAARKGVKVETEGAPEIPFYGDEHLLRQMVLNLLDNAIKHTPAGGRVRVSLNQSASTCELVIADTGDGIPVEAQPHIFDRFFRVDKARSRADIINPINGTNGSFHRTAGTNGSGANGAGANGAGVGAGLGLSIARWVAEAHGGAIRLVHSDPTGTVFAIALPLRRP